jgi:hypothetical protein
MSIMNKTRKWQVQTAMPLKTWENHFSQLRANVVKENFHVYITLWIEIISNHSILNNAWLTFFFWWKIDEWNFLSLFNKLMILPIIALYLKDKRSMYICSIVAMYVLPVYLPHWKKYVLLFIFLTIKETSIFGI